MRLPGQASRWHKESTAVLAPDQPVTQSVPAQTAGVQAPDQRAAVPVPALPPAWKSPGRRRRWIEERAAVLTAATPLVVGVLVLIGVR